MTPRQLFAMKARIVDSNFHGKQVEDFPRLSMCSVRELLGLDRLYVICHGADWLFGHRIYVPFGKITGSRVRVTGQ